MEISDDDKKVIIEDILGTALPTKRKKKIPKKEKEITQKQIEETGKCKSAPRIIKPGQGGAFIRKVPTPEDIQKVRNWSKIRVPLKQMAANFGISFNTVKAWINRYPELKAAVRKGRAESYQHAVTSAFQEAFPSPKPVIDEQSGEPLRNAKGEIIMRKAPMNTPLAIFLLKTMFGFVEPERKIKIEATRAPDELKINIAGDKMKPEDLSKTLTKFYDK